MLYTNRNIFIDKVINRILSKKNFVWSKISPNKVCNWLYRDEALSISDFKDRLCSVTGTINANHFTKLKDTERKSILEAANHTLNHEFDILGSGWTQLEPMDWKTDFIHNYSWKDRRFYRDYETVSNKGGRDIKVVWDLNRCHHLLWLGEAFLITERKEYAFEIIKQINDWIEQNPLMYSINWTCSMDVAIRAVNWIYSLSMICGSGVINEDFVCKVMRSLYEHLFFIANNLEKTIPNSGNHYLSDLVGVLFIAPLFPNNRFAKIANKFALKEFYHEALAEINEDGSNYENSISYHRLVTELFAYTLFSLVRREQSVPESVVKRISRAIDYIRYYTKPNGLAPMIGDNDNGRLLPFVPRDFRDHRYLSEIGQSIFNSKLGELHGEYIFMGETPSIPVNESIEMNVSDSGVSVKKRGDATLVVTNGTFSLERCKQPGKSGGSHTHPDNMSFELTLGNDDFFIDPGTYVYTSEPGMRNLMRATCSHNTTTVDNNNLAGFSPSSAFVMKQLLSDIEIEANQISDSTTQIIGRFNFDNGNLQYQYNRDFLFSDTQIQILDKYEFIGSHEVRVHFIVPADIEIIIKDGDIHLLSNNYELILSSSYSDERLRYDIEDYLYSPSYGILKNGKRITFTQKINNEGTLKTLMQWKERK